MSKLFSNLRMSKLVKTIQMIKLVVKGRCIVISPEGNSLVIHSGINNVKELQKISYTFFKKVYQLNTL